MRRDRRSVNEGGPSVGRCWVSAGAVAVGARFFSACCCVDRVSGCGGGWGAHDEIKDRMCHSYVGISTKDGQAYRRPSVYYFFGHKSYTDCYILSDCHRPWTWTMNHEPWTITSWTLPTTSIVSIIARVNMTSRDGHINSSLPPPHVSLALGPSVGVSLPNAEQRWCCRQRRRGDEPKSKNNAQQLCHGESILASSQLSSTEGKRPINIVTVTADTALFVSYCQQHNNQHAVVRKVEM